jgi:hypothetical protein
MRRVPSWEADQFQVKIPDILGREIMSDKTAKFLENAALGQFGRLVSTIRMPLEQRKDTESALGWYAKALLNTLTGAKLSDYNIPEEQARELRPAIENLLSGSPLVKEFSTISVPKEYRPYLNPEEQSLMRLLETLNKERRAASKAEKQRLFQEGKLPPWAMR